MKYYKVIKNYNGEFVSIDETELETAIYSFMTQARVVFKNGVARGQDILDIKPDFNKALGYNPEYKLQPDDYGDANRLRKSHYKVYEKINKRVNYLIANKQENLIGQNIPIPALESEEVKRIDKGVEGLADKFNVGGKDKRV
jgi:hypothetical protein